MHHVRRRDGQLGRGGRDERLQVPEVLLEDRVVQLNLAAHMDSGWGELNVPRGVVELHGHVARRLADAAQLVDEVHVPGGTPELTVGGGLQADLLLHGHDADDGLVFGGPQLVGGDPAREEVVTGGQQLGWAKEAADVVGAEWRSLAHNGHRGRTDPRRSIPQVARGPRLAG